MTQIQEENVDTRFILNDKERPWRTHKMANELLSMAYDDINKAKAGRLRACGSRLTFVVNQSNSKRLVGANFCRVRLCPVCTWRRSLKIFSQVNKIMEYLKKDEYQYILLTLTQKNCAAAELQNTIDSMMRAWNNFLKLDVITKMNKGFYRAFEITHNVDYQSEYYDTFHPHIHVIFAVKKSYFKSRYYIKNDNFRTLWQGVLKCDYLPLCNVQKVKGNTAKAVAEVAKYAVKPSDYIIPNDWDLTIDTVRLLDQVLANRRFVSFGGIFKDVHKLLNLDDVDEGDLLDNDIVDEVIEKTDITQTYVWNSGYNQYYFENPN